MFKSIWDDIVHQFRQGSVIFRIILICIAVFMITETVHLFLWASQKDAIYQEIIKWVALPISIHKLIREPWALFTFMFIHADFWHILYNMLWLYWFGEIYQLYMRDKRVWPVFIFGSMAGAALCVVAFYALPPLRPYIADGSLVGASAGIEAIMFAATALNPEHRIRLFIIGEVPLKFLAIGIFVMNYVTITYGNPGGVISHLGGAIFGFAYIKSLQAGTDWFTPLDRFLALFNRSGRNLKATHVRGRNPEPEKKDITSSEQNRLDGILDKISKSGYNSLSKEEKEFLFKYSNK
jgi:membrane associated rhomboid family serine protease